MLSTYYLAIKVSLYYIAKVKHLVSTLAHKSIQSCCYIHKIVPHSSTLRESASTTVSFGPCKVNDKEGSRHDKEVDNPHRMVEPAHALQVVKARTHNSSYLLAGFQPPCHLFNLLFDKVTTLPSTTYTTKPGPMWGPTILCGLAR